MYTVLYIFLKIIFKCLIMYSLTKEEKLEFIIKKCSELGITANDFGDNTKMSTMGAYNILTGKSEKPRTKNLNIMIEYLESKVVGTNFNTKEELSIVNESNSEYETSLEKIIAARVLKYIEPEFKKRDEKILRLRKDLKLVHDQQLELFEKQKKLNKNSTSA